MEQKFSICKHCGNINEANIATAKVLAAWLEINPYKPPR